MKASLPMLLGPLMTMIRGLGFWERGSELKGEPMEASRARRRSECAMKRCTKRMGD